MRKVMFLLLALMICFVSERSYAQDIIVKKDGTILNVYNLEESSGSYFYSLEPSSEASVFKINKDDVFSIKKQEGTSVAVSTATPSPQPQVALTREPVTAQLSSEITTEKKGRKVFTARTPDGHELNYAILSENSHTLTVIKGQYHEKEYVIPEYVQVNDVRYTITEIDEEAFMKEYRIATIQFPLTLKVIGRRAFEQCGLERIILPDGLEEIGEKAFLLTGVHIGFGKSTQHPVNEIYIPSSVKSIGANCFLQCGTHKSYRGYCQAYFSNLPDFITKGTCKTFGIDEEAVEAFYERKIANR